MTGWTVEPTPAVERKQKLCCICGYYHLPLVEQNACAKTRGASTMRGLARSLEMCQSEKGRAGCHIRVTTSADDSNRSVRSLQLDMW